MMAVDDHRHCAIRGLRHAATIPSPRSISTSDYYKLVQQSRAIPRLSTTRAAKSLSEPLVDLNSIRSNDDIPKQKTYLYLGYGSNMSALSFLHRRKIKPLAQTNVVVPAVRLTFDLTGIPYTEPCFGNLAFRDTSDNDPSDGQDGQDVTDPPPQYHKDRWAKGLVAIVYEVTATDFAHILATEGGGAAYTWISVDCHSLSSDATTPVPSNPTPDSLICKAYTLYSPARAFRPNHDPSYAQPSARYMKLLTDGATEHDLPLEYRNYLSQIRSYVPTTTAQKTGAALFRTTWAPITNFFFLGSGQIFLGKDGKYPAWYVKMTKGIFTGVWDSYDNWFLPQFGDGERTIEDGGMPPPSKSAGKSSQTQQKSRKGAEWSEKLPLLSRGRSGMGYS